MVRAGLPSAALVSRDRFPFDANGIRDHALRETCLLPEAPSLQRGRQLSTQFDICQRGLDAFRHIGSSTGWHAVGTTQYLTVSRTVDSPVRDRYGLGPRWL